MGTATAGPTLAQGPHAAERQARSFSGHGEDRFAGATQQVQGGTGPASEAPPGT